MSDPTAGTLDLAFLGCGAATRMHSRTLSRLKEDVRLHYASRQREKAAEYRERHGGSGTFGSYEAAIRAPGIDAVLVATPPATHLELTLAALEAGKDVIVEKPAFLRPDDFRRVREVASGAGRRVLVAENYFYKPVRRRLRRILREGLIGEPLLIQVNAVKRQPARGWRADPDVAGGGALLEGGIHWIDFMAELGMEVERVEGFRAGASATGAGAGEESVVVVLQYAEGAVGVLSYSWEVPSLLRGLRISKIYGREGSVTFESNGAFVLLQGSRTRFYVPRPWDISGYRAMFTDFLEVLRTGQEPEMTLDAAARDVRLVREAYGSLRPEPERRRPAGEGEAAGGSSPPERKEAER